jgi:hypothetical protein
VIRSVLFASCLIAPLMVGTATWAQRADSSVGDALTQPLRDLSILRREPAQALQSAAAAPYADAATLANGGLDCGSVASEIQALDAALGEDLDVATPEAGLMAQARTDAGNALVDAVGDLVELPYRGLIRRITGAERRDREMAEAVQAGMVRRAYLKGLSARECATPQLLAVLEPTPVAVATEAPLSDLELARRQLAAANTAATGALAAPLAADATAPDGAVTAAAIAAPVSDLDLARGQLAAANVATASSSPTVVDTAPDGASGTSQ